MVFQNSIIKQQGEIGLELNNFWSNNNAYPQQTLAYLKFYQETEEDAWITLCKNGNGEILFSSLIVKHSRLLALNLKMSYLFSVFGPVVKQSLEASQLRKAWPEYLRYLGKFTKKQKALYLKFYPPCICKEGDDYNRLFQSKKLIPSTGPQRPKETSVLDLTYFKTMEEFLKSIKPKWRYNIKLAQRKGAHVIFSKNIKYIDDFYQLTKATGRRQDFVPWSKKKYRILAESLFKQDIGEWAIAKYKDKILAIILITKFGDLGIYLKGASSNENRNVMPNHLLHFETIKRLKKQGYKKYDFFGVSTDPNDPLYGGITDFKLGFLPKNLSKKKKIIKWEQPYDLVARPLLYKFFQMIRK